MESDIPEIRATCTICLKAFSKKSVLTRHLRNVHKCQQVVLAGKVECPAKGCLFSCVHYAKLREHVTQTHGVVCRGQRFTFANKNAFDVWKKMEERKETVHFVSNRAALTLKDGTKKIWYNCHRSGRSFASLGEGKRKSKRNGLNRMNKSCPAMIEYEIKDEKVNVIYYRTHFGHDKSLIHIPLPVEDKLKIAAKLAAGIPKNQIIDDLRNLVGNRTERVNLVTRKDLNNIAKEFSLFQPSSKIKHEYSSTSELEEEISEDSDDIKSNESSEVDSYKVSEKRFPKFSITSSSEIIPYSEVLVTSSLEKPFSDISGTYLEKDPSKILAMKLTKTFSEDSVTKSPKNYASTENFVNSSQNSERIGISKREKCQMLDNFLKQMKIKEKFEKKLKDKFSIALNLLKIHEPLSKEDMTEIISNVDDVIQILKGEISKRKLFTVQNPVETKLCQSLRIPNLRKFQILPQNVQLKPRNFDKQIENLHKQTNFVQINPVEAVNIQKMSENFQKPTSNIEIQSENLRKELLDSKNVNQLSRNFKISMKVLNDQKLPVKVPNIPKPTVNIKKAPIEIEKQSVNTRNAEQVQKLSESDKKPEVKRKAPQILYISARPRKNVGPIEESDDSTKYMVSWERVT